MGPGIVIVQTLLKDLHHGEPGRLAFESAG
jgi:hypothetical protein